MTRLAPPSPKEVFAGLMSFVGKEKRVFLDKESGRSIAKEYLRYRCLKPGCPVQVVSFLEKLGFQNPYAHLKSCYAKGRETKVQDEALARLHEDAKTAMQQKKRYNSF